MQNFHTTVSSLLLTGAASLQTAFARSRLLKEFQPLDQSAKTCGLPDIVSCKDLYDDPMVQYQWHLGGIDDGGANICKSHLIADGGAKGGIITDGLINTGVDSSGPEMEAQQFVEATLSSNENIFGIMSLLLVLNKANNTLGGVGVSPQSKIEGLEAKNLKVSNYFTFQQFDNKLKVKDGLDYFTKSDAPIIGTTDVLPSAILFGQFDENKSTARGCTVNHHESIEAAKSNNILLIMAVPEFTSDNKIVSLFPGACNEVIIVGDTMRDGSVFREDQSSNVLKIDILAPGGEYNEINDNTNFNILKNIITFAPNGRDNITGHGPRLAAAIVYGHALNAKSFCPDVTREEFVWSMQQTAIPINGFCPFGDNQCGPGRLDAYASLKHLKQIKTCGGQLEMSEVDELAKKGEDFECYDKVNSSPTIPSNSSEVSLSNSQNLKPWIIPVSVTISALVLIGIPLSFAIALCCYCRKKRLNNLPTTQQPGVEPAAIQPPVASHVSTNLDMLDKIDRFGSYITDSENNQRPPSTVSMDPDFTKPAATDGYLAMREAREMQSNRAGEIKHGS